MVAGMFSNLERALTVLPCLACLCISGMRYCQLPQLVSAQHAWKELLDTAHHDTNDARRPAIWQFSNSQACSVARQGLTDPLIVLALQRKT